MAYNRIHNNGDCRQDEFDAGAAGIYPGMLVKLNSSGDVVIHATSAGAALAMFAAEDALQGHTVADAYTSGEKVTVLLPSKGTKVNALINAGARVDIAIGDHLISNGDGTLCEAGGGTSEEVIAVAAEALDLSASGAVDTLCAVIIM